MCAYVQNKSMAPTQPHARAQTALFLRLSLLVLLAGAWSAPVPAPARTLSASGGAGASRFVQSGLGRKQRSSVASPLSVMSSAAQRAMAATLLPPVTCGLQGGSNPVPGVAADGTQLPTFVIALGSGGFSSASALSAALAGAARMT